MKQSVLDRNAWLAELCAQAKSKKKQKGQDRSRLEMRGLKRGSAWKSEYSSVLICKIKAQRENLLCKCVLVCVSKQAAAQSQVHSCCTLILSTKLTLISSVPSASLNIFDCLHQFAGFHCGKWFSCLAPNIINTVEYYHAAYSCTGSWRGQSLYTDPHKCWNTILIKNKRSIFKQGRVHCFTKK